MPVGVALASLAYAARASAHPEMSPLLTNRYLNAALSTAQLEIAMTWLYGELPGLEERQRLDTNHDGRVSPGERDDGQREWQRAAPALFTAWLDGERLVLPVDVTIDLGGDEAVRAAPLVVELRAARPLARSPHELRLAAGSSQPTRPGELEISITPAVGWALASGSPARRQWNGPLGSDEAPRQLVFPITPLAAATPAAPSGHARGWGFGALAAFAGLVAALGLSRRRSRAAGQRSGNG